MTSNFTPATVIAAPNPNPQITTTMIMISWLLQVDNS